MPRQERPKAWSATRTFNTANAERPTSNAQRLTRKDRASFGVFLSCSDTSYKNPDQLFDFIQMAYKVRRWTEFFHAAYESQPAFCLAQFFETNAQFVQEVSTRLCRLNFSVVGKRRCAASQQLPCYVISSSSVWQRFREFNYVCSKFQQSVFEIVPRSALRVVLSVRKLSNTPASDFDVGRSALGVRRFLLHSTTGFPSVITRTFSSMP